MKYNYVRDGVFPSNVFCRRYLWTLFQIFLFFVFFIILFLVVANFASANLLVQPSTMEINVDRGVSKVFNLVVTNNESRPVFNVSFSSVPNFVFPVVTRLEPNESRLVSFSVLTQDLFNQVFVSSVSFLYEIPYSAPPSSFVVSVDDSVFVPYNSSILVNDSVVWVNLLSEDVVINDLGSGFAPVSIPALSNVSRVYNGLGSWLFYPSTVHGSLGFTGLLSVLSRPNTAFAHDSSLDRTVVFNVHSLLPPSALQLFVLSQNVSANNNVSFQGLLEVRNTQPIIITGVHLYADRWVSGFSENDFNLPALSSKIVYFNVTPLVSRTSQSNRSQVVNVFANSSNAGLTFDDFPIFINFVNLDQVTINGTTYTITVLGINETIDACIQHLNDVGFESCKKLEDAFRTNVTVVKEIEGSVPFTATELLSMKSQLGTFGEETTRTVNKMNLYLDKQDSVTSLVQNNSVRIDMIADDFVGFKADLKDKQDSYNTRFWIFISLIGLFGLFIVLNWLFSNVAYFDALEQSGQV